MAYHGCPSLLPPLPPLSGRFNWYEDEPEHWCCILLPPPLGSFSLLCYIGFFFIFLLFTRAFICAKIALISSLPPSIDSHRFHLLPPSDRFGLGLNRGFHWSFIHHEFFIPPPLLFFTWSICLLCLILPSLFILLFSCIVLLLLLVMRPSFLFSALSRFPVFFFFVFYSCCQ